MHCVAASPGLKPINMTISTTFRVATRAASRGNVYERAPSWSFRPEELGQGSSGSLGRSRSFWFHVLWGRARSCARTWWRIIEVRMAALPSARGETSPTNGTFPDRVVARRRAPGRSRSRARSSSSTSRSDALGERNDEIRWLTAADFGAGRRRPSARSRRSNAPNLTVGIPLGRLDPQRSNGPSPRSRMR